MSQAIDPDSLHLATLTREQAEYVATFKASRIGRDFDVLVRPES